MSVTNGPNLGKMISAADGDAFGTDFRKLLRMIDVLVEGAVISKTLTAPPGSPTNGDRYIVAGSPTGAWSGQAKSIAVWTTDNPASPSGVWEFYAPKAGWLVFNIADGALYNYDGSTWAAISGGGGGAVTSVAGRTGAVTLAESDIASLVSDLSTLTSGVAASAPLASPALTGNPTAPTQTAGNNSTRLATTAFVTAALVAATLAGDADVAISSPTNGQVLTYDSGSSKWKNAAAGGGGGGAPGPDLFQNWGYVVVDPSGAGNPKVLGDTVSVYGGGSIFTGYNLPTSTRGGTVEYSNSGGSNTTYGLFGSPNFRAGRHIRAMLNCCFPDTTNTRCFIGLSSSQSVNFFDSDDPSTGHGYRYAAFRFSSTASDAHIKAICGNSSAQTIVDTGVSIDTNSHRFAIFFDDANSQVLFYIDGALVATITTNIPTGNLGWIHGARNPSGSGSDLFFSSAYVAADF